MVFSCSNVYLRYVIAGNCNIISQFSIKKNSGTCALGTKGKDIASLDENYNE